MDRLPVLIAYLDGGGFAGFVVKRKEYPFLFVVHLNEVVIFVHLEHGHVVSHLVGYVCVVESSEVLSDFEGYLVSELWVDRQIVL